MPKPPPGFVPIDDVTPPPPPGFVPIDDGFSVREMLSNIPSSAAGVASDFAHAVTNPVDTGRAVAQLGGSVLEKIGRNFEEFALGEDIPPTPGKEDAANAVGQFYKDRYGSLDAIKQTAERDPVGMMVDVAGAGSASRIPGLSRVAAAVDPINAVARGGQAALKAIPPNLASKMYDTAAKFSTTLPQAKRESLVRTALEHGFLHTQGGVRRISSRIDLLDAQLDDLIEQAGRAGERIPVNRVFDHLSELRKSRGGVRLGAAEDLNAIDKIVASFQSHLDNLGQQMGGRITALSPEQLNEFKRSAYKDINWDAKRLSGTPVKEDTYKAMARAAKDAVSEAVPEASEINRLLGELLELQPHLIRSANRIDNRNFISLDTSIKTGAGIAGGAAVDATGTGAAIGLAASLLGNPKVKPRIALALKRLRDGDVRWIDQHIGDPAVRAAIVLAGNAEQIVASSTDDAQ
jgi:hypothetical protein